ncbi:MAG: leucine-rich repeat domain-containing protein, partial [Alistipes sp.]|nr:leucine-rich repeat domain-containing protein [Alistipes sp.]
YLIGSGAFRDCCSLTNITIPKGVSLIDKYTFNNCTSLRSIIIPDRVISINHSAFRNCNSLQSVICEAKIPPKLGDEAFPEFDTLIVPEGCEEAYLNSDWKEFL